METGESRIPTVRGETTIPPAVAWRLDGAPGDSAAPLVLCLHGMWMDEDFFAILLQALFDLPFRFLVPRAPFPVESRGVGRNAASWYRYDGDQEQFRSELVRTESLLLELVKRVEAEQGLAPRARVVLGFSQGGYCGSFTAVRNPDLFQGTIVSGGRVKTEVLSEEMRVAASRGFRVLLCHGRRDLAVPWEAALRSRDGLAAAGVPVDLEGFESGHSLGKRQIATIAEWLQHRLA